MPLFLFQTYIAKNPIENCTRISQNSNLSSGYSFSLPGLISCAVCVVLIRWWAGFMGKQIQVPCICMLNYFIFQMTLRNKNETLLIKCIIQTSVQHPWHFCAVKGIWQSPGWQKAAKVLLRVLTAQVDVKGKERSKAGCVFTASWCTFCGHCLFQKQQVQLCGVGLESEPLMMEFSLHPWYRNIRHCQGFSRCSINSW